MQAEIDLGYIVSSIAAKCLHACVHAAIHINVSFKNHLTCYHGYRATLATIEMPTPIGVSSTACHKTVAIAIAIAIAD